MALSSPIISPAAESGNQTGNILGANLVPQLAQLIRRTPEFISNFDLSGIIATAKLIAVTATIIFAVLLVLIFFKIQKLIRNKAVKIQGENSSEPARGAYDARWAEIKNHVNSFNTAEWKFAVIESDKLIDNVLEAAGFRGETMGERLTLISRDQIPEIGNLWEAHKLRNLLVHDLEHDLKHNEAISAVEVFERVLRELGALS